MNRQELVSNRDFAFMAMFEPAEGGDYIVRFPAIRGLVTEARPWTRPAMVAGPCPGACGLRASQCRRQPSSLRSSRGSDALDRRADAQSRPEARHIARDPDASAPDPDDLRDLL